MAVLPKICFDASFHEGNVGIGIFNFDTKEELFFRYELKEVPSNTNVMETMALVQTLKYIRERGIEGAHLFTDNQHVAKKGISNSMKEGLNLSLNWIPREFNEDADRLSKKAHTLEPTPLKKRTPKAEKPRVNRENPIRVIDRVKEYSLEKRLNLIKQVFADRQDTIEIISDDKVFFSLAKKDLKIVRMLKTLLTNKEMMTLTNRDEINNCYGRFKAKPYVEKDVSNILKIYADS